MHERFGLVMLVGPLVSVMSWTPICLALDGPYELPAKSDAANGASELQSLCGVPFVAAGKRIYELGSSQLEGSCNLEVILSAEGDAEVSMTAQGGVDSQFCPMTISAVGIKTSEAEVASGYCLDGEPTFNVPIAAAALEYVDIVAGAPCPVSEETLAGFCGSAETAGVQVETILLGQLGLEENGMAACVCEASGISVTRCSESKGNPATCEAFTASEVSNTVEQLVGIRTGEGSCESMCLSQFGGSKKKKNACLDFCRGG